MIVTSDTTAITTLIKVGRAELLAALFGKVLIPKAVYSELRQFHSSLPDFCELREVGDPAQVQRLLSQADRGEAEAICLSLEIHADVLLMDDKKGRRLAESLGIRCLGLPTLVLFAKRKRLIASATDFLELMERRGNFCLSAPIKTLLLREAGE